MLFMVVDFTSYGQHVQSSVQSFQTGFMTQAYFWMEKNAKVYRRKEDRRKFKETAKNRTVTVSKMHIEEER